MCAGHCLCKELGGGLYYLDGTEIKYPKEINTRNLNGHCIMTSSKSRAIKFVDLFSKSGISLQNK